jgi:quercetin dioxygenase-like cupin family protein
MKNEIIRVGPIGIKFLLEAAETNGAMAMFEFTVPVGVKMPQPHSHKSYDETVYGVEGVVTFEILDGNPPSLPPTSDSGGEGKLRRGKSVDIGPGESFFIPRGAVHGFSNLKDVNVKALAVITPGLLGPDFFREAAAIVNVGGKPDLEKLKAVMAKHGLIPAMPPKS